MVLSEARSRGLQESLSGGTPHRFHPAEVRQLRIRVEELREEQQSWTDPVFRRSIAREVRRLRRILQTFDEGTSAGTLVTDLSA